MEHTYSMSLHQHRKAGTVDHLSKSCHTQNIQTQQVSRAPRCHDASFFDQLGLGPNAQLAPGFFAHGGSTCAQTDKKKTVSNNCRGVAR